MAIEAARQAIVELPIDIQMLRSLRETAKLLTTHYSTQIEGNRLTQAQVAEVITGEAGFSGERFPGRERDEAEVKNYYQALDYVESLAKQNDLIQEHDVKQIHGLTFEGKPRPTPYRDGQNVIRDGRSGGIVYMPPEAHDVPNLMANLVDWINLNLEENELPAPLIAGLAHYQFATIHPYYDGNGRSARLLATLILHKSGYGLKGIYSLEKYYARNLEDYYEALNIGPSHNYDMGRSDSDVTKFVAYFCKGMAAAFGAVHAQAVKAAKRNGQDQSAWLKQLDPRERQLVAFLEKKGTANTDDIAKCLGLKTRTISTLCRGWIEKGLLKMHLLLGETER